MSFVPDIVSKEDFSRLLFVTVGPLVAGFITAAAWCGKQLFSLLNDRRKSLSAVAIQQDTAGLLAQNFWHPVDAADYWGPAVSCAGLFHVTNASTRDIFLTRIEPRRIRGTVFHLRVLALSLPNKEGPLPARQVSTVRIEFCLTPAPRWHGAQKLTLHIWDSTGRRRKVRAVYKEIPQKVPNAGAP